MTLYVCNITLDCEHPQQVAAFWSAALSAAVDDGGSEYFCSIGVSQPQISPNWFFIKVPEPRTFKNRMHVAFDTADRAGEVARLVSLGATHVADHDEWGHTWSVLRDMEGNEFCVAERPH